MAPEPCSTVMDPGLGALSLPAAAIRRAARGAAPDVRFSSEAIAGLHRVAQAFICFATDRALHEAQAEADKAKKVKGKANPTARKTLSADHVMRFLSSDMPPIAKKLASLVPEQMPAEYRPAGIRLLEQLQEQDKAAEALRAGAAGAAPPAEGQAPAPRGSASLLAAFGSAPPAAEGGGGSCAEASRGPAQPAADVAEAGPHDAEPEAKKVAKAPRPVAPLARFFGARGAPAAAAAAPAEAVAAAAADERDGAAPGGAAEGAVLAPAEEAEPPAPGSVPASTAEDERGLAPALWAAGAAPLPRAAAARPRLRSVPSLLPSQAPLFTEQGGMSSGNAASGWG
eukprot:CAMPEP_0175621038 /NCGR_PEP_ID=MMETSP0096-20121207/68223_1 /TAXON_ID=311494 /ORGANISM="Alexandrium monilatum, Strain CCMP3105" /LENGTH=340 /DNA_ID=CAMNT_0016926283 /DNA_START=21 /DNA_END=1041 /DNA_ORIENTATION=-